MMNYDETPAVKRIEVDIADDVDGAIADARCHSVRCEVVTSEGPNGYTIVALEGATDNVNSVLKLWGYSEEGD